MTNKNYRSNSNDKFQELKDEFEDYGYDVKNARRQSKKKVTKFKTRDDEYYDSFWTGTLIPHLLIRWGIVYTYLRNQMVFIISQVNGCTYTLDANNQTDLMYAPLLSDGSYETAGSAYDYVEFDCIDGDVYNEAVRCHDLLMCDSLWTVHWSPQMPPWGAILNKSTANETNA